MKRQTDRIVPLSCWEQLRTGKVWQRLSLALLVAVMTLTAQTARAGDGDVIYVSETGDDYNDGQSEVTALATISWAVSVATGGETIYILNGEYSEDNTIELKKSLSFEGQSQDGVKITGPANSLFSISTTETGLTLSFTNLTILNAGGSSNPAFKFLGSENSVTITNCTFDNCGSKYGAMQLGHSGTATIDGCTFLHSKATANSGTGAIYISAAGTYTIENAIIDDVQLTPPSETMNGAIFVNNTSATLNIENTTITNVNAPSNGVICTKGAVNMTGCEIKGNTIGSASSRIIDVYNNGSATIEQTIITDNTCENELFYNRGSDAHLTVNYCNIHDNTASGIVNNQGTIDLESNYWGSNELPEGITATTWVVEDNGEYKLNTGDPLEKEIPVIQVLTNIVTPENFYRFFDANGELLDAITFDELIFQGEFTGLAAGYVIINKPITITGDYDADTGEHYAVLKDMGIAIISEDVTIDNLTLTATTSLGDLIYVGASNVDLTNLNISYIVGDESADVINVASNEDNRITDVSIINNTIYFESHVTSEVELVTAINLDNVEDVIVDGNTIVASMPGLDIDYTTIDDWDDWDHFFPGLKNVNPVRVLESDGVKLTNNNIDVTVNSCDASYPTVQALYIADSEDILVKGNDFKMVDEITPEGEPIQLYAVQCGFSEGIEFIENNFNISTTGGQSGAGTAYVIQTCSAKATFIGNNITCESNCSSLGISIYSIDIAEEAKDLVIEDNFINVTGLVPESNTWSLLSGIEIETGHASIKNNTIYVQNKVGYVDNCSVSGISAIQYCASALSFDIRDNEILVPDGKYAVDIRYTPEEVTVTGNTLCAHESTGDDAIYIKDVSNLIVIEDNHGLLLAAKKVTVDGQTDYWTTFYCGGAGFKTDACAYTATVSDETITLHKLGQVIPKGTAVIIVGVDNSISMTMSTAGAENEVENDLHGLDMATPLNDVKKALSADAILVLASKNNQNFGFHELATTNVPARKAFLAINDPDPSIARQFTMVFENATGIQSIDHSPLTIDHYDGAWYSLDGRRLNGKPTAKGVYVKNGKKVVIK